MKRLLSIAAVILLVGVIAVPSMAQSPRGGKGSSGVYGQRGDCEYGPRGVYDNLSTEQREQLDALHKKFYEDTKQLRKDLRDKRIELYDILDTDNPDLEKAKSVQKELSDLQAKMADKRIGFIVEKRKIAPDARFGRGLGRRMGSARGWSGHGHAPRTFWR
jgi:zinc resistance-associated protein